MFPPPSSLPRRESLLGLVSLLVLLVVTIPWALSLRSADAAGSVGATGNDSRAFPKTFHLWGGYPSNYTHYDFVIGYPAWDLASLRAANPGAIYVANPMLDPFNSDWTQRKGISVTYGAEDTFTGATDTVVDGSAANLGTIPGWNDYWDTLHHPDGTTTLVNSTFGHPGWNLTRTDTADKVAKIEAYGAKLSKVYRNGWDGIWSDNWIYRIGAGWFYGSNLDTNRDGQLDDMTLVSKQWWDGLNLAGLRLRSYLPGKIVGGNGAHNISGLPGGSDPNGPFKASNVTMNEVLQYYTTAPDTIVSEVQSYLGFTDPYGMPRYFLLMHKLPGGQSDYRSMRWGFSLATIAGGYYEPYAVDHNDAFKYDEFTGGSTVAKRGWLGVPVTPPTKLSNGVWRRDFANGVVLNNSTSSAQTVSLGATYQRLKGSQDSTVNSGASVSSVSVPAGDGLFLLGSSSTSTGSPPANTTPPTISGSAVVGQTLSASTGSWSGSPTSYAYQWQLCDSAGASCTAVSGATGASYRLSELDVGSTLRVKLTATNAYGSTSVVSAPTSNVVDVPFVVTQSIAEGSTLTSMVTWSADTSGKTASSIDFSIDGKVVLTDGSSPYGTSVDTKSLANGSHTFAVKAIASDGTIATASATATVSNQSSTLMVAQSISNGQTLSGSVPWSATTSGEPVSKLDFAVDGAVVASDSVTPYEVTVDTTHFDDGAHTFSVKAVASDGKTAAASAAATVANTPTAQTFSVTQNVDSGQTLVAVLDWVADPAGKPVKRVEFSVDGAKVATAPNAPYEISFDTRKLSDGAHTFGVSAYATDGTLASASAAVIVSNTSAPQTFSVTQNLTAGQTLAGTIDWIAEPTGKAVRRVEFSVDGGKVSTEPKSPYQTSYDTRKLADGSHTFAVKAYATDGATATISAQVSVSNQTSSGATAPAPGGSTTSTTGSTTSTTGATTSTNGSSGDSTTLTLKSSILDGSTITDSVSWTILASGKQVSKMDFFIDDRLSWTEHEAPWMYGGDHRLLNTRTLTKGAHTLKVKAYAVDGTVAVLTLEVTVV
jgi:hypothetical protein